MPAKLVNKIPSRGLYVVTNHNGTQFYTSGFKIKQSAKKVRDELNADNPAGGWHVAPGPNHWRYLERMAKTA